MLVDPLVSKVQQPLSAHNQENIPTLLIFFFSALVGRLIHNLEVSPVLLYILYKHN